MPGVPPRPPYSVGHSMPEKPAAVLEASQSRRSRNDSSSSRDAPEARLRPLVGDVVREPGPQLRRGTAPPRRCSSGPRAPLWQNPPTLRRIGLPASRDHGRSTGGCRGPTSASGRGARSPRGAAANAGSSSALDVSASTIGPRSDASIVSTWSPPAATKRVARWPTGTSATAAAAPTSSVDHHPGEAQAPAQQVGDHRAAEQRAVVGVDPLVDRRRHHHHGRAGRDPGAERGEPGVVDAGAGVRGAGEVGVLAHPPEAREVLERRVHPALRPSPRRTRSRRRRPARGRCRSRGRGRRPARSPRPGPGRRRRPPGARSSVTPAPDISSPHPRASARRPAGSRPCVAAAGMRVKPLPLRSWTLPPSWSTATVTGTRAVSCTSRVVAVTCAREASPPAASVRITPPAPSPSASRPAAVSPSAGTPDHHQLGRPLAGVHAADDAVHAGGGGIGRGLRRRGRGGAGGSARRSRAPVAARQAPRRRRWGRGPAPPSRRRARGRGRDGHRASRGSVPYGRGRARGPPGCACVSVPDTGEHARARDDRMVVDDRHTPHAHPARATDVVRRGVPRRGAGHRRRHGRPRGRRPRARHRRQRRDLDAGAAGVRAHRLRPAPARPGAARARRVRGRGRRLLARRLRQRAARPARRARAPPGHRRRALARRRGGDAVRLPVPRDVLAARARRPPAGLGPRREPGRCASRPSPARSGCCPCWPRTGLLGLGARGLRLAASLPAIGPRRGGAARGRPPRRLPHRARPPRRVRRHRARSVIGPGGQRVSGTDRLYLTEGLPTLVVWGDRDPVIPVGHARRAARAHPARAARDLRGRRPLPALRRAGALRGACSPSSATPTRPPRSTSRASARGWRRAGREVA